MKIFSKKTTAVASLVMTLALTGCFQDVPSDKNSTPSSTQASPSASASPSATAKTVEVETELKVNKDTVNPTTGEEMKKAAEQNKDYYEEYEKKSTESPLGIDVKSFVAASSDPQVKEIFVDFNVEEGTRASLDFYQKLISNGTLYQPRDAKKDFEAIVNVKPMMTPSFIEALEKDIAEKGKFNLFPVTDDEGVILKSGDKELKPAGAPISTVWPNNVTVHGEYLVINGYTESAFYGENIDGLTLAYNWQIFAIPSGESSWHIKGLTYSNLETK